MAGSGADEQLGTSVLRTSWGRLVWLLVGLAGALLSALVIHGYEEVLQEALALAMFIPVVMAMAGSTAIQSSTLTVQGLARGHLWPGDLSRRLGKELAVALINGTALALLFGAVVLGLEELGILHLPSGRAVDLALTAGLALLSVVVIAAALGSIIPLALNRVGVDPALATGPFITTSNDILGLVVYFGIAAALYL
jgi:magnesium transporter